MYEITHHESLLLAATSEKGKQSMSMDTRSYVIAGLAFLSMIKKVQSGDKNTTKTWSPLGFSWNPEIPLFHATVGYSKIENSGRLKLRSQLIAQNQTNTSGAGGTLRGYISTTTEARRALAIAIGVNILRKAAQGEYHYIEFDKQLESIYPGYKLTDGLLRSYEEKKNKYEFLRINPNYTPEVHNFDACAQMYKSFLQSYDNAFNPTFFGPEYENHINIDKQDIGVITGFSDISRLCMGCYDAYEIGFIPELKQVYKWLDNKNFTYKVKRALNDIWQPDVYNPKEDHYYAWDKSSWGARGLVEDLKHAIGDYIGDYKIEWLDKQEITLDSVMTVNTSEQEVEIWNPSRYKIDWEESERLINTPHFNDLYLPRGGE